MSSTTLAPPAAGPVAAALGQARRALDELADADLWSVPDGDLDDVLAQLVGLQRAVLAQASRVAAEAADRGLPVASGSRDVAGWVRAAVPTLSRREARAIAGRAAGPIARALAAGVIGLDHARVVTETIAAVAPHVDARVAAQARDFLLGEAEQLDPVQLRRLADHLRYRLDPDADARLAADERAQHAARGLTVYDDAGGMVRVEGRLTKRAGAALRAALDAWSAPQPSDDGTPDPRTAAQRRHDALERVCEAVLVEPGLLPSTHGSAYRVLVHVPVETLLAAGQRDADETLAGLVPARLPSGAALSSGGLREISAAADWTALLVDNRGSPLDLGRTQRLFSPKQRLAITARDDGCTYPGCSAPPSWCDVHHLRPWADGGRTDLQNGALLCGRHHRHITRTGELGELVDGEVRWAAGAPASGPRLQRLVDDLLRRCGSPAHQDGGPDG